MRKLITFYNTLKYLKPIQVFGRIKYLLPRIIKPVTFHPKLRSFQNKAQFLKKKNSTTDFESFEFLNCKNNLNDIGWNNTKISKLWLYNLHYFDFLLQENRIKEDIILKKNVISDWIKSNDFGSGIGWEPYPTSIRIINWIKWHWETNSLGDNEILSLWNQVRWLERNLEIHLQGNHLFVNVKALIFATAFFDVDIESSFFTKAKKILSKELDEQFLNDGGHFELSPMYHSLGIEDLLDILNISIYFKKELENDKIQQKVVKALDWLTCMSYDNFELSHFNDSASNIAPKLFELVEYSKRIGLDYVFSNNTKITYLKDSGFVISKINNSHLIADVGKIGPDYLPGHSHADTLSFELAIDSKRIIVNSGTSLYEYSPLRMFQRGTSSHSTLLINKINSSEVWSSFRVGKRALPINFKLTKKTENEHAFSCGHTGYSYLKGHPIHYRTWRYFNNQWSIQDKITGEFKSAYIYFYFHPDVKINIVDSELHLQIGQKNIATITFSNVKEFKIENSFYYDEFGEKGKRNLKLLLEVCDTGFCNTNIKF